MEVFCHPCARRVQGRRDDRGDWLCAACGSDFVEVVEAQAAAPTPAPPVMPALRQHEVFLSSFTLPLGPSGATPAANAAGAGAGAVPGAALPQAQVTIIQETIPLDLAAAALAGRRGVNAGDYATNDQLDAILGQLMQAYAPRRRPTSQAFIDELPRLPVPSASEAPASPSKPDQAEPEPQQEGEAEVKEARKFASCVAGDACPVCHDALVAGEHVLELPCQHCYHEACILPWLREHNDCPVCRRKFELEADHAHPAAAAPSPAGAQLPQGHQAERQRRNAIGPTNALLSGYPAAANLVAGLMAQPAMRGVPRGGNARAANGQNLAPGMMGVPMTEELLQRLQRPASLAQRHAELRSQHMALEAQLRDLEQTSRQQLAALLQQQPQAAAEGAAGAAAGAAPGGAPGDGVGATPLADLADRLRNAQRAVNTAQRHLLILEAQMQRVAAEARPRVDDHHAVPFGRPLPDRGAQQQQQQQGMAEQPAPAAEPSANVNHSETMVAMAAPPNAPGQPPLAGDVAQRREAMSAMLAQMLGGQQQQGPTAQNNLPAGDAVAQAHMLLAQMRRDMQEGARRDRERLREDPLGQGRERQEAQGRARRQQQQQQGQQGSSFSAQEARRAPSAAGGPASPAPAAVDRPQNVAVDAVLTIPTFLLAGADPRPVPLGAFMQPLSADDRVPTAALSALLPPAPTTSAPASPATTAAPRNPTTSSPVAGARSPPPPVAAAMPGFAIAAARSAAESSAGSTPPGASGDARRNLPVSLVAGALAVPRRVIGGLWGMLAGPARPPAQ